MMKEKIFVIFCSVSEKENMMIWMNNGCGKIYSKKEKKYTDN